MANSAPEHDPTRLERDFARAWDEWNEDKAAGRLPILGNCPECGALVYPSPGGNVCDAGHGGVDAVDDPLLLFGPKGADDAPTEPDSPAKIPTPPSPAVRELTVSLTAEQIDVAHGVMDALKDGAREILVTGPSGSGKTTVILAIVQALRIENRPHYLFGPTGRAAVRLREVVGPAQTIHRGWYRKVEEDLSGRPQFGNPIAPCGPTGVCVVDEAGMVHDREYAAMLSVLPRGAAIIWVCDPDQLVPVRTDAESRHDTSMSPAIKNNIGGPRHFKLTQVHRQSDTSPISTLGEHIRRGDPWPMSIWSDTTQLQRVARAQIPDVANWLLLFRRAGISSTALAWSNKTRRAFNAAYRVHAGRQYAIEAEDRICVLANQHTLEWYNGDVFRVDEATHDPQDCEWGVRVRVGEVDAWVNAALIGGDLAQFRQFKASRAEALLARMSSRQRREYEADGAIPKHLQEDADRLRRYVHIDYGECITIHKAQGAEYDAVAMYVDYGLRRLQEREPDTWRRLMYVAVTRAKKHCTLFQE